MSPRIMRGAPTRARVATGLTALALSAVAVGSASQAYAAPAGPVAAYAFNEASGSSVGDLSGSNNGGTTNASRTTAGRFGGALVFNGSSQKMDVASSASLGLSSGMTLEAWVKPAQSGGWRTVLLRERSGSLAYALYANDSGNVSRGESVIGGTERSVKSAGAAPVGVWTHLATTYDGSTIRFFVNGTQTGATAASGAIATSTGALRIGGNAVWGEWFNGSIDEVRVYGRSLSATEIATDMKTPISAPVAPPVTPAPTSPVTVSGTSLTWSAVAGATGYKVYEADTKKYVTLASTARSYAPAPRVGTSASFGWSWNGADGRDHWQPEMKITWPAAPAPVVPAPIVPAPIVPDPVPAPPPATPDPVSTPSFSVSGTSLVWEAVPAAASYKVYEADTKKYVTLPSSARSYAPAARPGAQVGFGWAWVGTDGVDHWLTEKSIAWPAGSTPTPVPPNPVTPDPVPAPAPRVGGMEWGYVANSDITKALDNTVKLKAKLARVEFEIGAPTSTLRPYVDAARSRGIEVLLLAGFHGRTPTQSEAQNLGNWAREFGPGGTYWAGRADANLASRFIEFGNETSYSYQGTQDRGGEYALRFKDAYGSIHAANPAVGLLAQADDANSGSPKWVNDMFNAVPNLGTMVAGWTVHPYGPRTRWEPRIDRLISFTSARGASSSIPIDVTEWGLATDDGRTLNDNYSWPTNMNYSQAADAVNLTLPQMLGKSGFGSRLRMFMYYQAHDQQPSGSGQREHYFGALRNDGSDKGALTATLRTWATNYPAH